MGTIDRAPAHRAEPRRRPARTLAAALTAVVVGLVTAVGGSLLAPPSASAAPATLGQVAAASTAGNRTAHTVNVPSSVQAGDVMVLVLTWNTQTTVTGPTGWTALQTHAGSGITGRVWTRVATASDAGSQVRATSAASAKSVMSLTAYRSSGPSPSVTASAQGGSDSPATSHTTPAVPVADEGSWLVSAWAEKSGTDTTWTLPAEVTQRTTAAGTGTGKVSQIVGDSGGPVAAGTAAGRTATTSTSVNRSALFSVVVSPGVAGNRPPVAVFAFSCGGLACNFDATGSSDPDGDPLTYAWNFGDNSTGSGVSPSHTYAGAGTRNVTLTVSDGTTTSQSTQSVTVTAPVAQGNQPKPGHTTLVPEKARAAFPRITGGEIWDIETIGNKAYVAGTFSSAVNVAGNGATVTQPNLMAINLDTGLIDTTFRPTFGGGGVSAVEASPDGTKLFVTGSFDTVNGVAKAKIASLSPTTGAPVAGFTANANSQGNALAVSNTTVYVGGRFSKINGVTRVGLAAVSSSTGAVDLAFDNQLSGGIGTNGTLTVQQLKLTHDSSTLVVVHTARRIDDQNRYGIGLIDTASKQLLPWRTHLWEDNLQYVGGIQRIYAGDVAPDDSYFVVGSGSGGDRPPINDTAVAFSFDGGDGVEPLWISRCFDSVYSVAITEKAVYIGGHFQWNESPTAPDPWPGQDDIGYGTGQGLSGYGLGDQVVRRDHLGALDPATGKALEWHPGSNSIEGNKALQATSQGLLSGGDAKRQGGVSTGRVAFFRLADNPAPSSPDTTITSPIQGRVVHANEPFTIQGDATVTTGSVARVQVEVQSGSAYLQDDLTTWSSTFNTIDAQLSTPADGKTSWSLPLTVTTAREMTIRARAVASSGAQDPVKAEKKIESFSFDDLPPSTRITGPSGTLQTSTTFILRGTATDDNGVSSIILYVKDIATGRYLTPDGSLVDGYTTFRIDPDVPDATSATWQYELNLPNEGDWKVSATAVDTAGQSDTRQEVVDYTVDTSGQAPSVTISTPLAVTPPTPSPSLTMAPGGRITFTGTATDDQDLATVEVSLRNTVTRDNLGADGSWGPDVIAGFHKISPANFSGTSYDWSYTMPEDLEPGTYTFAVRATDKQDLTTSSSYQGRLTINVAVPGDAAPNGLLSFSGTDRSLEVLHLDLAGTATDDKGVASVGLVLREADTGRYLQPDGTLGTGYQVLPTTLAAPGATSTGFSRSIDLPRAGDWNVTAFAIDSAGQTDTSTTGATARYLVYPGDADPALNLDLVSPPAGTVFEDGRIFVSGRAEDDVAMARVEVAVVNSSGLYMTSTGTFSGTTERWISAFLNSPGSPGSNYSYTTPAIPAGAYTVRTRPVDSIGQFPASRDVPVSVTIPASNAAPVANATFSCASNVCTFDGRTSIDESPSSLSWSWNFGNGRTASGSVPTVTYTSAGTFTVTLTVKDEYGVTGTTTLPVTITEPAGNVAPTATISTPTCVGLVCGLSGATSTDPNAGDTFTYLWNFGDGTPTSTTASSTHTFPAAGTYVVTLTVTDGWGKASTTTRSVTVAP
ncbi:PKD domain-containing protein [Nocardioides taihuensis]|uniref:PKD domain-containing protein n=1 Tax=Nocardioides taihuensis TaxID=1835606 RepID=A0ABW0BLN3_9ACTN